VRHNGEQVHRCAPSYPTPSATPRRTCKGAPPLRPHRRPTREKNRGRGRRPRPMARRGCGAGSTPHRGGSGDSKKEAGGVPPRRRHSGPSTARWGGGAAATRGRRRRADRRPTRRARGGPTQRTCRARVLPRCAREEVTRGAIVGPAGNHMERASGCIGHRNRHLMGVFGPIRGCIKVHRPMQNNREFWHVI